MFDLPSLIKTVGYIGVFAIVFAESGLLFGFFLPGDSLLFTAGFLASQGFFEIALLTTLCFIAAILGDSTGYYLGHKYGRRLFHKKDSLFFHKDHLKRAEDFYEKHGGKTIIVARFMPIIRTFAPIVAGVGKMKYGAFLTYNIIGAVLWAIGLTLAGYFLGSLIPDIDTYLFPLIGLIILLSILPPAYHIFKSKQQREIIFSTVKSLLFKRNL